MIKGGLLTGLVLGLTACGDNTPPAPAPAPAPAPQPIPPPTVDDANNPNYDYTLVSLVPYLQYYYGDVTILQVITVNLANNTSFQIPAGRYPWAQLYTDYVIRMARECACSIQGAPAGGSSFSGWVNLNFGNFDLFVGGSNGQTFTTWREPNVRFQNGLNTDFYTVFNTLVSYSYVYVVQWYYPYYMNNSWGYGMWPGVSGSTQSGSTFGGSISYSNGQFRANLGGIFGR